MAFPKPDFSGEWILDRTASALSPGADAVHSGTARIDHREPGFKYQASFVSDSGTVEVAYELQTDGREVIDTGPEGTTASSLDWDGDALVTAWKFERPDYAMTISFRHELLDEGRRLRATETLRSAGHNQDNVWEFERAL
jgi:hypothetical protein